MENLTKPCEVCGAIITKPETCSRVDWPKRRFCSQVCKAASQRGKDPWNKGWKSPEPSSMRYLPCRICGGQTRYHGTERSHLFGQVHCERPECIRQSREIRNARIGEGQRRARAEGRKVYRGWNHSGVSTEESSLIPWFASLGWVPQFRVRLGHSWCRLDFAESTRQLYIEIDGDSHRHRERQERDARRDTELGKLGWQGLRLTAAEVRRNPESAKAKILHWIAELTHDPS